MRLLCQILILAFAQTQQSTNTTGTDAAVDQAFKDLDRLMSPAKLDELHKSTLPHAKKPIDISPMLKGIREFRDATSALRENISGTQDIRQPIKDLEKAMKPIADYFEDLKLRAKPVTTAEFKGYSEKDMLWETLTSAETIDNNLQIARKLIANSQRTQSVTIQAMLFYESIHSDLARLKWLASKAQQPKAPSTPTKSQ
jgi:hypothetical protein